MQRRWQVNFTIQNKIPKRTRKSNKETTISELVRDHMTLAVYPKGRTTMMPKRFADMSLLLLLCWCADALGN
jgi:hypothetical protein